MSIQQNLSKAEGNLYSRPSLTASLKLLKVIPAPFLRKFCKFTLLLLVPLAFSYKTATPARAATLWYNGDPDGQGYRQNQFLLPITRWGNGSILDDFTVPSTNVGWQIDTLWSYSLLDPTSFFSQVSWKIQTVGFSPIFSMLLGTTVASGNSPATITPTTFQVSNRPVFRISVSGLDIHLDPGTYWLSIVPTYRSDSFPFGMLNLWSSYIVTTRGANAVGTPPGNNGNSYSLFAGYILSPDTGDYSMGIEGRAISESIAIEGETIPEPSSMFSLLGFGALTLSFRWWRKQQLSLDANKRAIDSD